MPRFNLVKKGYDPAEVDRYIENLEQTIDVYKQQDAAIKNAIVNAQIAADNIKQNADTEAAKIRADILKQLGEVKNSISVQKQLVDEFKYDYNLLIKQYITDFNGKQVDTIYSKIKAIETYFDQIEGKAKAPEENVLKKPLPQSNAAPEAAEAKTEEPKPATPSASPSPTALFTPAAGSKA